MEVESKFIMKESLRKESRNQDSVLGENIENLIEHQREYREQFRRICT